MDYIKLAREVLTIEEKSIRKTCESLGQEFSDAIELILSTLNNGGKIVVTGIGKNLHIAEKISATLASTGSTSVVLNPSQAIHGDLGILSPSDVLLAISYSGESEELIKLIPLVKRFDLKIISLSGTTDNSLANSSDITIPIPIEKEACPFNMAPTSSTTTTLAIGDALAMVLLEARGFKKEDYAKLHPGGAIGRSLLLRVSDIMRSEDRLATVSAGANVQDALLAMTKARSGSVCVVDDKGHVKGIFTDGDLRRHISEQENVLELPIDQVMTVDPLTVKADQLAVDVMSIYEHHNIDDLIVVDADGVVIGSVDIQDLPRVKLI